MTDTEAAVRDTIQTPGVHVVHIWAPWCDNSLHELAPVWSEARQRHPDVSVTFVSIWSDGDDGDDVLRQHGVDDVEVRVLPGPKPEKPDRRLTFLGLPVSWIPTTWVFNREGMLATAFNYGEITAEHLAQAIEGAQSGW